jgi:hypothetical protein
MLTKPEPPEMSSFFSKREVFPLSQFFVIAKRRGSWVAEGNNLGFPSKVLVHDRAIRTLSFLSDLAATGVDVVAEGELCLGST